MTLRELTIRNRVWLSPMCQYSATDGMPGDWQVVHLGARASGGFGLLITEAAAVLPEGRISDKDTGVWDDTHIQGWRRVTEAVHERGASIGIQLAHAGRKGSAYAPGSGRTGTLPVEEGGWATVAPSAVAFEGYEQPGELGADGLEQVVTAFAAAARRADAAGFDVVEVHAAHGYLLHQFLSPLSNHRGDDYAGTLENRARLLVDVVTAVRGVWPAGKPLFVRMSATDWVAGGLTVDETVTIARWLRLLGVDLVDVSSGGNVVCPLPVGPGYQVPLARAVRAGVPLPVSAVGLITSAAQAEQALVDGAADAVMIGRAALRDPMWPLRAAHELGVPVAAEGPAAWPLQYVRGAWD
jgi:2,4-dienoyl-CoA reductase-like NADH-dependent reductase (Old Yellow Enzyme family)